MRVSDSTLEYLKENPIITGEDSDFDPISLCIGVLIELEHGYDFDMAKEIAKDHLTEDSEYYGTYDYHEEAKERIDTEGDFEEFRDSLQGENDVDYNKSLDSFKLSEISEGSLGDGDFEVMKDVIKESLSHDVYIRNGNSPIVSFANFSDKLCDKGSIVITCGNSVLSKIQYELGNTCVYVDNSRDRLSIFSGASEVSFERFSEVLSGKKAVERSVYSVGYIMYNGVKTSFVTNKVIFLKSSKGGDFAPVDNDSESLRIADDLNSLNSFRGSSESSERIKSVDDIIQEYSVMRTIESFPIPVEGIEEVTLDTDKAERIAEKVSLESSEEEVRSAVEEVYADSDSEVDTDSISSAVYSYLDSLFSSVVRQLEAYHAW